MVVIRAIELGMAIAMCSAAIEMTLDFWAFPNVERDRGREINIVNLRKLGAALFVVLLMVVVAPQSASAAIITLAPGGTQYQQGDQNPCIFWNDSCKNSSVQ